MRKLQELKAGSNAMGVCLTMGRRNLERKEKYGDEWVICGRVERGAIWQFRVSKMLGIE